MPLENFVYGKLGAPNLYTDRVQEDLARPPILVSGPVSPEDFKALKESRLRDLEKNKQRLLEEAKEMDVASFREKRLRHAAALQEFPLDAPDSFATQSIGGVTGYFYRNGRIYPLHGNQETFRETTKPFRARVLYDIPREPGVCFPYGFLADNGFEHKRVEISMRLVKHPDVAIYFETSQANPPRNVNKKSVARTIEQEHANFWTNTYAPQHKETWLKGLIAHRSVVLDGRKGIKTFGEIKRKDGTTDFGYLAIVKGDPSSKEYEPDLFLFVVRTATQSRGKTPVTEDELKDIAEAIAASLKRRW